jgi:hypothetical protein
MIQRRPLRVVAGLVRFAGPPPACARALGFDLVDVRRVAQQLDYAQFLTLLLADEVQRREQQALERHLLQAGFEDRVTLDGFDWTSPVQLDRRQLQQVFTLEFLARKEHVVFVGPGRRRKNIRGSSPGDGGGARRQERPVHARRRTAQRNWARRARTTRLRRSSAVT